VVPRGAERAGARTVQPPVQIRVAAAEMGGRILALVLVAVAA
jgi:hypothetical protein